MAHTHYIRIHILVLDQSQIHMCPNSSDKQAINKIYLFVFHPILMKLVEYVEFLPNFIKLDDFHIHVRTQEAGEFRLGLHGKNFCWFIYAPAIFLAKLDFYEKT